MKFLIKVLEASIAKNGDQVLTVSHLLNIVKVATKWQHEQAEAEDRAFDELFGADESPCGKND